MSLRVGTRGALLAVAVSLVALALPFASMSANASQARVVVAGLTPVPTSDTVVHRAITTSFDLALTQRHDAALSAYIASLSNTGSRNYHHYLTPAQYAARYGASAPSVAALRTYFEGYGLRVTSLSAGHDILHVTGTTTDIARAFDAPLETVRMSDGALDAHFTSSASLPRALAGDVTAVAGLDTVTPLSTNLELSRDVPSVATAGTCPAAGSSSGTTPNSVGGYTVQQQAGLYGLTAAWSAGHTGVGQTIGVYELANYDSSDAQTYFTCYGLTPTISSAILIRAGRAGDGATTAVTTAPVAVAGVFQPRASKAATSAACFESLISKNPWAPSSPVGTPGSTSSFELTYCTWLSKCVSTHCHPFNDERYTSVNMILPRCFSLATPLIFTSGATGVALPGVRANSFVFHRSRPTTATRMRTRTTKSAVDPRRRLTGGEMGSCKVMNQR